VFTLGGTTHVVTRANLVSASQPPDANGLIAYINNNSSTFGVSALPVGTDLELTTIAGGTHGTHNFNFGGIGFDTDGVGGIDAPGSISAGYNANIVRSRVTLGDLSGMTRFGEIKFTIGSDPHLLDAALVGRTVNEVRDYVNAHPADLRVRALVSGTGELILEALGTDNLSAVTVDIDGIEMAEAPQEAGIHPISVQDMLKFVDTAIADVTEGSAMLGATKALLETQEEFIGVLSDSLTAGVSAFIDADMNEVSTRFQAQQTQQQLGVQALSMANQNSQMILKLFQ